MMDYLGSANLSSTPTTDAIGTFISAGDRLNTLEIKVAAIQLKVDAVPEGTDFLIPEDVQPLFNNKKVIYDV